MSNDSSWKMEDIMDYFGEFVDEDRAKKFIEEIKGDSYWDKMNSVRMILISEGYSVSFRSVYRRTK